MNGWYWIDSGKGDAAYNMALDEALLEAAARLGRPVLRWYGWTQPAATFGYFQKFAEVERTTPLRPLIRRPTGGGIVPHDRDWTYSAVFPPQHEWYALKAVDSYQRIHDWLRLAFETLGVPTELAPGRWPEATPAATVVLHGGRPAAAAAGLPGQCFIGHEKSDLLWRGRKIAGAAQRRNRLGLLIQGSVQPPGPPPALTSGQFTSALRRLAEEQFSAAWTELSPDPTLRRRAETLAAEKYSRADYNREKRAQLDGPSPVSC
jgi:lipoate-protein ligase A